MMMLWSPCGNLKLLTACRYMRGLMAAPNGYHGIAPILSNFREGLSIGEILFSTHGA